MSFSEEILMAYADGELDEATRRGVEQAMRQDPSLAARVRRHQALRRDVYGAFAPTLEEVVPQRLHAAARSPKVVHLDTVRAARLPPPVAPPRRWSWPEWGAIAATLVLGVGAGTLATRMLDTTPQLVMVDGVLSARGVLDQALTQQLASAAPRQTPVRVGLSFLSREGNYCRTFMLPKAAGLACRSGAGWTVPVLAEDANAIGGQYRQAGSALPEAVLDAIDQRIAGKALDIAAEQAARDKGWGRK